MKWLVNRVMSHRSRGLLARLRSKLPPSGIIADIGSGTGHNAEEIRRLGNLAVHEFDVADLHWVGPGPEIVRGNRFPVADHAFDGLLLAFVLQYPNSPHDLLRECRRVSRGPLMIFQSTYRGRWGRTVLAIREFVWGRLALRLALLAGLVRPGNCSLQPRHYFTRLELMRLFTSAGLVIVETRPAEWRGFCVSRDLFVLKSEES